MDSTTDNKLSTSAATASPIAVTERLRLRALRLDDAPFMLQLLNEPGWLRYIGDRGVHSVDDAKSYIVARIHNQYERYGYGMYGLELKQTAALIGVAGLVKRDHLPDPDLGFALLDRYAGQGLAFEAATAVMAQARALGLPRLLAITVPDNRRSIRLLERLAFVGDGQSQRSEDSEVLQRYVHTTK